MKLSVSVTQSPPIYFCSFTHREACRHTHQTPAREKGATKLLNLRRDLCYSGWDWGWCVSHLKGGTSVLHLHASPYEKSKRAKLWYSVKENAHTFTHRLKRTSSCPVAKTLPMTRFCVSVGLASCRKQMKDPKLPNQTGLNYNPGTCTSVSICKIFATPKREGKRRKNERYQSHARKTNSRSREKGRNWRCVCVGGGVYMNIEIIKADAVCWFFFLFLERSPHLSHSFT